MAISPEMLKESFNKEVTQFEEYFDQRLAALSLIRSDDVLCVDIPKGLISGKHFTILKARYKQAGWKDVEHVTDPRDGDYLKFKS